MLLHGLFGCGFLGLQLFGLFLDLVLIHRSCWFVMFWGIPSGNDTQYYTLIGWELWSHYKYFMPGILQTLVNIIIYYTLYNIGFASLIINFLHAIKKHITFRICNIQHYDKDPKIVTYLGFLTMIITFMSLSRLQHRYGAASFPVSFCRTSLITPPRGSLVYQTQNWLCVALDIVRPMML